ncbi:MAG: T9SS type A sorting domain-containing protein [Candidatus Latescibacterota bacterium]
MATQFQISSISVVKSFRLFCFLCLSLSSIYGFFPSPAFAQAEKTDDSVSSRPVTICWDKSGSASDHYRIQIMRKNTHTQTEETSVHFTHETVFPMEVERGFEYRIRHQIVNENGAFSDYSDETLLSFDTLTGAENNNAPNQYSLSNNYPNPFNPSTTITYSIPRPGLVKLSIYNINGQEVARLVDNQVQAGTHTFVWDASDFASGAYFCIISAEKFTASRKMILIK